MRRALVVVLALSGCAGALVRPTDDDVRWLQARGTTTTLAEMQRARSVYVAKCAGCHALHRPEEFPPERWPALVDEMVREQDVKLSAADRRLVELFLTSTSARLRTDTDVDNRITPAPDAAPR